MAPKVSLAPDVAWEPAKRRAGHSSLAPSGPSPPSASAPENLAQTEAPPALPAAHQAEISTITALTGSAQHVRAATGPGRKMAAGLPEPGRRPREARPTVIPGNRFVPCPLLSLLPRAPAPRPWTGEAHGMGPG